MDEFLLEANEAVTNSDCDVSERDVHLVIGNEAADLDSVISSIVMGYLLNHRKDRNPNLLVVPVVGCHRKDLPLRTEVTYWLRKHAICPDWLTYQEEITRWWTRVKGERFRSFSVTLVDHNMPFGDMEFVTDYVVRIVDHHNLMPTMKERLDLLSPPGELLWDLVGSCCTLVAQCYFEGVEKGEYELLDEEQLIILSLLYGVILLDTLCLSPLHERFNRLDVIMLESIESKLGLSEASRGHTYHELEDAKFDVKGLTNTELLYRDVKFLRPYLAICSICGLDYTHFIHLPDIVKDITNYCQQEALGTLVILTLGKTSPKQSELRRGIIVSRSSDFDCRVNDEVLEFFRNDPNLDIEPFPSPKQHLFVFRQHNAKLSRKYIMPALAKVIANLRESMTDKNPYTPLNTPLCQSDSDSCIESKSVDLPSFNNLATVEKVQAKRDSMRLQEEIQVKSAK